jgi:ABC-type multidrug transport system fused ATPase/permease subunit
MTLEEQSVPVGTNTSPAEVYRERAARFERECDAETRRWNRVANIRLFTFLVAAASIGWGVWQSIPLFWVGGIVLLAVFFGLVVYHNIIGKQRQRHEELWKINVEAGHRLARKWDALPLRHMVRADADEPYAADLDIFGRASLFQLLETVSTHVGEATLGQWLREFAPPQTVRARQEAVAELAPLIDLRDELALRGRLMGEKKPDPARFLAWAEGDRWLAHRPWLLWVARSNTVLFWALALAHAFGIIGYPLWFLVAAINLLLSGTIGRRAYQILTQASAGESGFKHYADSFELISHTDFKAGALKHLQERLKVGGLPAHAQMRRLQRLSNSIWPASSQLYLVIQAVALWDIQLLSALERWQVAAGGHAREWLDVLGEMEALSALSVLAHDNPDWAFPDVTPEAVSLEARDLGHPLLPGDVRVNNDVTVGPPGTFLMVSGSNMSGKSTLLRAIGVNIVLAGAGGPVCASALRLPPVSLWTSMRVADSLERGVSFFMAELQRLKKIVDAARACREGGDRRLFYLLDEILQGTNTHERQIAARRVIMYLAEQGALGAVSTHDLGLADPPEVAAAARSVHFTETIRRGQAGPEMTFDYKLRSGVATSTNALRLMEIVGLELGEGHAASSMRGG